MKKTPFILAAMVILLTGNALFAIPPFPPGGGSVSVSDTAYNATTWDGETATAPSKNAVRDKIEAMANADTSGYAGSLKSTATTGKMTITGPAAGETRAKTIRDANDTLLELGGSYTPTGTWNWGSVTWTNVPTLNQNTTGTAAGLAAQYIDWNEATGGASIANKPTIPTASSLSVDDLITLSGMPEGSVNLGEFTGTTITDNLTIKAAIQALETYIEGLSLHDSATLSGDAVNAILGLTGQALSLKTQAANKIFAGPASGGDDYPAFRDMVADDLPSEISGTLSGFYTISGTTDGDGAGDGTTVVDATTLGSYADDWFNGGTILITSGTYEGVSKTISDFATTSGTVTVSEAFAGQIVSGTTYQIRFAGTPVVTTNTGAATQGYPIFGGPTKPRKFTMPDTDGVMATSDSTNTFTNKTLDANGTGNVLKGYGYITLRRPNNRGSATTAVTTTETDINYGMPTFADDVEANNYIDYFCEVPRDIDTAVDLVAWFKFRLGDADTADHDYIISMVSIADSAAQAGTPGNAINLSYSADASGASGDVETAGGDTLTDWKSNVTAGNLWMIRITRDGDDGTNDASTVDSYPVELTIRYGWTQ